MRTIGPSALAALLLCGCALEYRRAMADGDAALHEGRYASARRSYAKASSKADPKDPRAAARARNSMAAASLLLGRPGEAEAEFRRALEALEGVAGVEGTRGAALANLAA